METKIANNNMEYKEYTVVAPLSLDYYHGFEWNLNLDIFPKLEHSPMVQLTHLLQPCHQTLHHTFYH